MSGVDGSLAGNLVVGQDRDPGSRNVVSDLGRSRLLVDRADHLLIQLQKRDGNRRACGKCLGPQLAMRPELAGERRPLAFAPQIDLRGQAQEIATVGAFMGVDLRLPVGCRARGRWRALHEHADVSAVALRKLRLR